jgi:hypothetical protein
VGLEESPQLSYTMYYTVAIVNNEIHRMPQEKDQMIAVRLTTELLTELDAWREGLTVPPTRSDALRYLIKLGLEHAKGKKR